jgi:hypothetical protein
MHRTTKKKRITANSPLRRGESNPDLPVSTYVGIAQVNWPCSTHHVRPPRLAQSCMRMESEVQYGLTVQFLDIDSDRPVCLDQTNITQVDESLLPGTIYVSLICPKKAANGEHRKRRHIRHSDAGNRTPTSQCLCSITLFNR